MNILVIEDTPKHLNDAKEYVNGLVGCNVDFAMTFREAEALLKTTKYDAVISDVFFPQDIGASAETYENALAISKRLMESDIYHVFNTSLHHHGKNLLNEFGQKKRDLLESFNKLKLKEFFGEIKFYPQSDSIAMPFTNGHVLESDIDGKEALKKQWKGSFRVAILASEFRPKIVESRDFIISCFQKKQAKELSFKEFDAEMYKICPLNNLSYVGFGGSDYGNTTKWLDEQESLVEVFKRYNA